MPKELKLCLYDDCVHYSVKAVKYCCDACAGDDYDSKRLKQEEKKGIDPVHQDEDGQWWFWDEVWADRHGPYKYESDARHFLQKYCDELHQEK